jgi:long-chain fatty acid transport protein
MSRLALARLVLPAVLWSLAVLPRLAAAAGFEIREHGARGLGSAFAGEAAIAEDARTVFWNPAGMTLLEGTNLVGSGQIIFTNFEFEDQGSRRNPAVGGPLLGRRESTAGEIGLVPNFYLSQAVGDRFRLGLGVDAPFGLRTDWDPDWVGRYHAVLSDLLTINFNPSFAVRLLDQLSIGAGMSIMYADAELTNFIDLGTVCVTVQGLPPGACSAAGLPPQGADAFIRIKGDDWSFGWNVGALFHPTERTRIGAHYRSRVDHTLEGSADFSVPSRVEPLVRPTGQLRDTGGKARLTLPDSAILSGFHQLTPTVALLADVSWTHWELFRTLDVDFENPRQIDISQVQDWRDSFRYALGIRWDATPRWSFRTGAAYDEEAVRNPVLRDPRIPDTDRVWFSLGFGYQVLDWARVDVGYAHIFALATSTENRDPVTQHQLRGDIRGYADVVGAQLTLAFP